MSIFAGFQSKEKKVLSIIKYGIPDRGPEFHQYENHILAYDQAKKIPVWVAEYITKDHTKGSQNSLKSFKIFYIK